MIWLVWYLIWGNTPIGYKDIWTKFRLEMKLAQISGLKNGYYFFLHLSSFRLSQDRYPPQHHIWGDAPWCGADYGGFSYMACGARFCDMWHFYVQKVGQLYIFLHIFVHMCGTSDIEASPDRSCQDLSIDTLWVEIGRGRDVTVTSELKKVTIVKNSYNINAKR